MVYNYSPHNKSPLVWAEVEKNAIKFNLRQIKNKIGNQVDIMGIVKDNAYGHGAVQVSKVLSENGVSMLGVSDIAEAFELKEAGINKPILILSPLLKDHTNEIVRAGFRQAICDLSFAKALSKKAKKLGREIKVHVKIDTGMGRLGVLPGDIDGFITQIMNLDNIKIEGIFTHLSSADCGKTFSRKQITIFSNICKKIEREKLKIRYKHIANSAAILFYPDSYFNMVRPGVFLYGLLPSPNEKLYPFLRKPVLSLKAKIIFIKDVKENIPISYERTYYTKKSTRIATIAAGYGDGYSRLLSNKGEVLIKGKRAKIIGRVCMDHIMADIGYIPNARVGDIVTLIGRDGNEIITMEEISLKIGTISYEIACSINQRIPRIYI